MNNRNSAGAKLRPRSSCVLSIIACRILPLPCRSWQAACCCWHCGRGKPLAAGFIKSCRKRKGETVWSRPSGSLRLPLRQDVENGGERQMQAQQPKPAPQQKEPGQSSSCTHTYSAVSADGKTTFRVRI